MPARITEIKAATDANSGPQFRAQDVINIEPGVTRLKVEGTLHLREAELLEGICRQISTVDGRRVVLELHDLCSIDSAGAQVLCRMKREQGVRLQDLNLFVQKVVDLGDELEEVVEHSTTD